MANIGDRLVAPESGWIRLEENDPTLILNGTWKPQDNSDHSGGRCIHSNVAGDSISFILKGTRFRIIGDLYYLRSKNIKVQIDNLPPEYFSEYIASGTYKSILVYEKQGLSDGIHNVVITNEENTYFGFDAIDIDENGRIYHPMEVESFDELTQIGMRIRANYSVTEPNTVGKFGGFGQRNMSFLPPIPTSSVASGDFFLIYVGDDRLGRKILIADRNIQAGISSDSLNNVGLISGIELPGYEGITIKLLSGGASYTDTGGEWDEYIVNSEINANDWNIGSQWSHVDAFYTNTNLRLLRGSANLNAFSNVASSSTTQKSTGFRPMLIVGDNYKIQGTVGLPSHIKINANNQIPYRYKDCVIDLDSSKSQYLKGDADETLLHGSWTVDFWVNLKSYTAGGRFLEVGNGTSTNYIVICQSSNKLCFVANGTNISLVGNIIPLNEWVHIAVTYDFNTGTISLYQNGELTASQTSETKIPQVSRSIIFIGRSYAGNYLDAKLNEIRIWNKAKTNDEINSLMEYKADGYEAGLVHLWNFDVTTNYGPDPTTRKIAWDIVPHNPMHLTFYGHEYMIIDDMGWFGAKDMHANIEVIVNKSSNQKSHLKVTNAIIPYRFKDAWIDLDSSKRQYLSGNERDWLHGSWTVEFWTCVKSYTYYGRFLELGSGVSNSNIIVIDQSGTTGRVRFVFFSGGSVVLTVTSSTAVPLNQWVHVAVTYDYETGTASIYLNNVLVGMGTSQTKIPQISRKFFIGKSYDSSTAYLNVKLNEFRIWDTLKTQDEINELMYYKADGYEPNLVSLWNFDLIKYDDLNYEAIVKDITPNDNDLVFYGGKPIIEYDTTFQSGYNLYSNFEVLERNDLSSQIYVNPYGLMSVKFDVLEIFHDWLESQITVKRPADLKSLISIRPWGIMSLVVDVVPPPRIVEQFKPVKDAFIRSGVPRLNYGTSEDMFFGYNQEFNENYRSLVAFDISSLPKEHRIEAAKLKLYFDYDVTDELELELCEVEEEWTELGVTWANQPNVVNVIRTFSVGKTRGYVEVDLLDVVQEWYNDTRQNNGFIIRAKDETIPLFYRFYTKERSSNYPILEVTYYDPRPKSVDYSNISGRIAVQRDGESDLKSKIQIFKRDKEENLVSRIRIRNLNYMIESFISVTRDSMYSTIKTRRTEENEIGGTMNVRVLRTDDLASGIFAQNPDLYNKIVVRRNEWVLLQSYIAVRRTQTNNMPTIMSISKPDLPSIIEVTYSSMINSSITVVSTRDKEVRGRIKIRQIDESDLESLINVVIPNDLPSQLQVNSGYLKSKLIVPYQGYKDLVAIAKIEKGFANDLESKLFIGVKYGGGDYAFIL
mgnify:CR=1 FL=1